jgi:hypothetical protein
VIRWLFTTLAPLIVTAACGPHSAPAPGVRSPAPLGSDSTDLRAAEYAVYAAVLADVNYEVRVAKETHEAWNCEPASASLCDPGGIPAEYREALRDYMAKGAAPTPLPRTPAPARPVRRWQVPQGAEAQCWAMPTASLSRVGFNADSTRAVMSYSESSGPGPFPGCGYVGEKLLLLRRTEQGDWIATVAAQWMT